MLLFLRLSIISAASYSSRAPVGCSQYLSSPQSKHNLSVDSAVDPEFNSEGRKKIMEGRPSQFQRATRVFWDSNNRQNQLGAWFANTRIA